MNIQRCVRWLFVKCSECEFGIQYFYNKAIFNLISVFGSDFLFKFNFKEINFWYYHTLLLRSYCLSSLRWYYIFWDIKISFIFLLNCYCCSAIVRRIWRSYETRRVLCMTVKLCKYILYFSKNFIIALRKEKSLRKLEIKEMSILVI